jgi:hypothetical protein
MTYATYWGNKKSTMNHKADTRLVLVAVLLSLTLAGCGRISQQEDQASDVNISLTAHPDPPGVGLARLTISVSGADGTPIDGAQLHIKGDMTHAGMQPVLAEVKAGDRGKYETPFEWTMGGDWILTVTADLPDGRTTARQFTFRVEGDICGIQPEDAQSEASETE